MEYLVKDRNPVHERVPQAVAADIWMEINQISTSLRAFALQLMKNKFDANDLYQDTVLCLIAKVEKYTPGTNFKAWAMTIMRNIFVNNYRRKKRLQKILDPKSNNLSLNLRADTSENMGETKMAYRELLRMLSTLPENFKRPFWMAFQGYKYREIAEDLAIPLGTVKCRIFFARQTLQNMYTEANKI